MVAYKADCTKCQSLCCVGLAQEPGNGFPKHKDMDVPCERLDKESFRCTIFGLRRVFGYSGCDQYDCLGAGQRVSALMWERGHVWTDLDPATASGYFRDLNGLHRINFLIVQMAKGSIRDDALLRKLKTASRNYGTADAEPPAQTLIRCFEEHAQSMERILQAGGYRPE